MLALGLAALNHTGRDGGQGVVPQTKVEELLPAERELDCGQAETTDVLHNEQSQGVIQTSSRETS